MSSGGKEYLHVGHLTFLWLLNERELAFEVDGCAASDVVIRLQLGVRGETRALIGMGGG